MKYCEKREQSLQTRYPPQKPQLIRDSKAIAQIDGGDSATYIIILRTARRAQYILHEVLRRVCVYITKYIRKKKLFYLYFCLKLFLLGKLCEHTIAKR